MAASNIESEIISSEEQPTDQDTTNRTPIGAKLVKKLETLGECVFPPLNLSIFSSAANSSKSSSNEPTSNESESSRNVNKIASMSCTLPSE